MVLWTIIATRSLNNWAPLRWYVLPCRDQRHPLCVLVGWSRLYHALHPSGSFASWSELYPRIRQTPCGSLVYIVPEASAKPPEPHLCWRDVSREWGHHFICSGLGQHRVRLPAHSSDTSSHKLLRHDFCRSV